MASHGMLACSFVIFQGIQTSIAIKNNYICSIFQGVPNPCPPLGSAHELSIYFLHMIDLSTRFSLASVIRRKTPDVIGDKVVTHIEP